MWFIGDTFLLEIYHTLSQLKSEVVTEHEDKPYIYDFYTVSSSTASPVFNIKNILPRIINVLVQLLNEDTYLPRFIVIVPGDNIVNYVHQFNAGTTFLSGTVIEWIVTQMNRAVMAKKEAL